VFFEVAVVEAWVGCVEGWLCCIDDWVCELVIGFPFDMEGGRGEEKLTGLIDEFTGLHDGFLKSKTQSVRHLRF
jgi:hypothetical protein